MFDTNTGGMQSPSRVRSGTDRTRADSAKVPTIKFIFRILLDLSWAETELTPPVHFRPTVDSLQTVKKVRRGLVTYKLTSEFR